MSKRNKALTESLRAQIHIAINDWLTGSCEGETPSLKVGGVTVTSPQRIQIRVVDADFRPHTYNVFIEESK